MKKVKFVSIAIVLVLFVIGAAFYLIAPEKFKSTMASGFGIDLNKSAPVSFENQDPTVVGDIYTKRHQEMKQEQEALLVRLHSEMDQYQLTTEQRELAIQQMTSNYGSLLSVPRPEKRIHTYAARLSASE